MESKPIVIFILQEISLYNEVKAFHHSTWIGEKVKESLWLDGRINDASAVNGERICFKQKVKEEFST